MFVLFKMFNCFLDSDRICIGFTLKYNITPYQLFAPFKDVSVQGGAVGSFHFDILFAMQV